VEFIIEGGGRRKGKIGFLVFVDGRREEGKRMGIAPETGNAHRKRFQEKEGREREAPPHLREK